MMVVPVMLMPVVVVIMVLVTMVVAGLVVDMPGLAVRRIQELGLE